MCKREAFEQLLVNVLFLVIKYVTHLTTRVPLITYMFFALMEYKQFDES